MKVERRPYTMRARAEAAQETEQRILEAALRLFSERFYDQVTLADVAAIAGVSTQTVIRRFSSKDGLVAAVAAGARAEVRAQRDEAPAGDISGAIATLVEHYEQQGDGVLHLLAQEGRVPAFHEVVEQGRRLHYDWVDRVFGEELAQLSGDDRAARRAQLIAVCDVYVWKVLRRDLGLSTEQTERVLIDLVEGA